MTILIALFLLTHGGVDHRGDHAMGFSHEKTKHSFKLDRDGGAIEIRANDGNDEESIAQIRAHLPHIATMFAAGDFDVPMFIHDKLPDGADVMKQKKDAIRYEYREIERGGKLRITTSDPAALNAVHRFLRFQIKEHKTGDPLTTND